MELHHLEAFLAVADELHFARAADRLHMAQPPLSRMIKQLERELGSSLFDRTTRSVQLTTAGNALVRPAMDVLEGVRAARRAVRSAGRGETGLVRVGFAGPSSHPLVGRLGRLVRELHPGIELSLRNTTYHHEGIRSLLGGDLDLVFSRWQTRPEGVSDRLIAVEHYVVVVPVSHRLAGRKRVSIADLEGEPFVVLPANPGSSAREAMMQMVKAAGYSPQIVQTGPDTHTVLAMVAAGVGVTITHDTAVAGVVQTDISVIALKEGDRATYQRLVWRKDDQNPALLAVLRASEEALPTPWVPGGKSND
ncbi:LysR substrate-binding domain-containing protein (plasmid) [Arthrobacter sp. Z1-9]